MTERYKRTRNEYRIRGGTQKTKMWNRSVNILHCSINLSKANCPLKNLIRFKKSDGGSIKAEDICEELDAKHQSVFTGENTYPPELPDWDRSAIMENIETIQSTEPQWYLTLHPQGVGWNF